MFFLVYFLHHLRKSNKSCFSLCLSLNICISHFLKGKTGSYLEMLRKGRERIKKGENNMLKKEYRSPKVEGTPVHNPAENRKIHFKRKDVATCASGKPYSWAQGAYVPI